MEKTKEYCQSCEMSYVINYRPDHDDYDEPRYCPFCGEEIIKELDFDE